MAEKVAAIMNFASQPGGFISRKYIQRKNRRMASHSHIFGAPENWIDQEALSKHGTKSHLISISQIFVELENIKTGHGEAIAEASQICL